MNQQPVQFNFVLADMVKDALRPKHAFVPADPAAAGGAPMDPAAAGGAPMDPAAAGGAPPGDPAAMAAMGGASPGPMPGGGMAPPVGGGLDPAIQNAISAAVQNAMGGGGAAGAAGGKGAGGKKGDPALEIWKMNYLLTAMIGAMNEAGMNVKVDPQMMLGPMPGTDPSQAMAMSGGPGGAGGGPVAPGQPADPNAAAAGGGQPAPPGGGQLNYLPNMAAPQAKTGAALAIDPGTVPRIGSPVQRHDDPPLGDGLKLAFESIQQTFSNYNERVNPSDATYGFAQQVATMIRPR